MTAHFTLDRLAAPAAPFDFRSLPSAAPTRPTLRARWHVAADGRLACRWLTDDAAPDFPPD